MKSGVSGWVSYVGSVFRVLYAGLGFRVLLSQTPKSMGVTYVLQVRVDLLVSGL